MMRRSLEAGARQTRKGSAQRRERAAAVARRDEPIMDKTQAAVGDTRAET